MPRHETNSFVKQAAILAAASLFVRIIGFAYRIPFQNMILETGIAYYVAAYSIYTVAIALSSGALPAVVSRLVSARVALKQYRNAHRMFYSAMVFAVVGGIFAGIVVGLGARHFAEYMGVPGAAMPVRTLAPTLVFVAVLAVYRGFFQGMKDAKPTALSQVVEQIFKVICTLWLAHMFFDAANIAPAVAGGTIGTGIGAVAGLVVVVLMFRKQSMEIRRLAIRDRGSPRETREMQLKAIFRTALPMIISMLIFSSINIIDQRMASSRMVASGYFTVEDAQALFGQYTGQFLLLITLPISLSVALSAAVLPEITSSSVTMDARAVRHKTNMALRISMMLSIPAAVGLAVLADPILTLLFPNLPEAGAMMRVGAISIIFMATVHVMTGTLQGIGQVGLPIVAAFFGVVAKVALNHVLIARPGINIMGAVISTIVCYVIATGINMYFVYRHTGMLPRLGQAFIKPTVSAVGMGMVCLIVYGLMPEGNLATLAALGMGAVSYVMFMSLLKGFRKSDVAAMPLPSSIKRLL